MIGQRDFVRACFEYTADNKDKIRKLIDEDIKAWFREEYAWLEAEPNVEVLWHNTDFGVG